VDEISASLDLSAAQFADHVPFDTFAELRKQAPVYWYEPESYWVVSTYELVSLVNRDPAVFSSSRGPGPASMGNRSFDHSLAVTNLDPPRHTTYRRLVSHRFTPRQISLQEESVRRLAREVIGEFVASGGGDFVTKVAMPFPLRVIGSMIGIAREDEEAIIRRVNAEIAQEDPEYAAASADELERIHEEMRIYYDDLLDEHRSHPRGDLIDDLLGARINGQPLSQDELRTWVAVYISGGAETTRHLLSNGLAAILEHPDALLKMIQGADLTLAVEEMFRWITPVMQHSRWPLEDVVLNDVVIKRGERTTLWMISANRDARVFTNADEFDITRSGSTHHSLGAGGPHFCLGAGLARIEARILFEELRTYLPRLQMEGRPVRMHHTMFNGLKHLLVSA
jgi:cholest-4-en-3-one 26-monooxygenase